jgi:internalin A
MSSSFPQDLDEPTQLEALARAERTGDYRWADSLPLGIPQELRELKNLRAISVRDADLEELPDWLADFPKLEILDLGNNRFHEFPHVITELKQLKQLCLSRAPIDPSSLARLRNLRILDISGTDLKTVPDSFAELADLQSLNLSRCENLDGQWGLNIPISVTHLYIWGIGFLDFPTSILHLNQLRVLELSSNGSVDLSGPNLDRSHKSTESHPHNRMNVLVGMTSDESDHRISEIPEELGLQFPHLQYLYLSGQKIETLPLSIYRMKDLVELHVQRNHITELKPGISALTNLLELDLRNNRLTNLPADLRNMSGLKFLSLSENSLSIPPEILDKPEDPESILHFLSEEGPSRQLNEAKLLVVGEGSVGKTSLIKRLVTGGFNPDQHKTEGIDITRWSVSSDPIIDLNIWDFGGQEVMHSTHQFFLTKRSMYLLVIDARQGEEQNRIEYWLKIIQSFSGHSPIIIVGNKSDESTLDIDRRGLMAKYPEIVEIVATSCATGIGIAELSEKLSETVSKIPHVHDLVPTTFFDVKEFLESLHQDYLPFSDYQQLCNRKGIASLHSQELLIGFLHDLGTVLCFRDDPRLADTNILNPTWVTGGVYRILNSNLAAQLKGLLEWADINAILDCPEYPAEHRSFIVDMMKKFELCYESDNTFLVPDLLTKEEPDTGSWSGALAFEIRYEVLPQSILSRLIVRMCAAISQGTVWRTGVVLTVDQNRALVKADREDSRVSISVLGASQGQRGLLTAIRTELRAIESATPGLNGEELVPVPDQAGKWVPYDHLLKLEAAGRTTVTPVGLTTEISIRDLLDGVEFPQARLNKVSDSISMSSVSEPDIRDTEVVAPVFTAREAIQFGLFLLAAFIFVVVISIGAYVKVGGAAAAITGGALTAVLVFGFFILRASGRLSEKGFLAAIKSLTDSN